MRSWLKNKFHRNQTWRNFRASFTFNWTLAGLQLERQTRSQGLIAHLIDLMYQICYHMGSAQRGHMTFGSGSPLGRGSGVDHLSQRLRIERGSTPDPLPNHVICLSQSEPIRSRSTPETCKFLTFDSISTSDIFESDVLKRTKSYWCFTSLLQAVFT